MSTHDQVNASPITRITSWVKFLGKNLHLVGCATLSAKSEVMLTILNFRFLISRIKRKFKTCKGPFNYYVRRIWDLFEKCMSNCLLTYLTILTYLGILLLLTNSPPPLDKNYPKLDASCLNILNST